VEGRNLCACSVCLYDTNGSRIDIRLLEQSLEQVDLRLTVRVCNRMGIAALICHYVPDNSVYVIVFCDMLPPVRQYERFRNRVLRLVNRDPLWLPINQ
jgi:hypothetical protein